MTTGRETARRAGKVALALLVLGIAPPAARAQLYDDPELEEALTGEARNPASTEGAETTEEAEPTAPAPPPAPARAPGHSLRRGKVNVTVTLEASLSKEAAFKPFSIAPDLSYGVTDDLTVSLVHSGFATTGFRGSAGGGLCLAGADGGCAKVYDNAGAEALFDLVRGKLAAAAVGGVHALSLDAGFYDLKLGARVRYQAGTVLATFMPSVLIGVTERDAGNKGSLFLPLSIGAQVARPLFVAVGGGVAAPLSGAGDGWTGRVGLIASYRAAPRATVAASFFLPRLAGGDAIATGADVRTLNVWLNYSL